MLKYLTIQFSVIKNRRYKDVERVSNQLLTLLILKSDDLNKPKILYSEIVKSPQFYFDSDGIYTPEATSFLMIGK